MTPGIAVYLIGVAIGLIRVDGSLATKVVVAALWPLGAAAAAITVAGLLGATLVLFPWAGLAAVAAGAVWWWLAA